MSIRQKNASKCGFTLVELIVAMVVISVALVGVMSVINYTTLHSADPVLRQQAIAIAEAYMEEIVLKDYADLADESLVPFEVLETYTVSVSVTPDELGPSGETVDAFRIDVTVTDPAKNELKLTGYRTNY